MLTNAKSQAFSIGDINQFNLIDKELLDTQNTFAQLTMLSDVTQAAQAVNSTPAELIATGIQAAQNQTQGPSAGAIINGYDVSAYATDSLYEQKIRAIINSMPPLTDSSAIDTYIRGIVGLSPVTGDMVYSSAIAYGVDIPLLVAIMQNDSAFGTLGVGARTFNPGNVGNTGSAERSYNSWQEGVSAVADWLNKHRVNTAQTTPQVAPNPAPTPSEPAPALAPTYTPSEPASSIYTAPQTILSTPLVNDATTTSATTTHNTSTSTPTATTTSSFFTTPDVGTSTPAVPSTTATTTNATTTP